MKTCVRLPCVNLIISHMSVYKVLEQSTTVVELICLSLIASDITFYVLCFMRLNAIKMFPNLKFIRMFDRKKM